MDLSSIPSLPYTETRQGDGGVSGDKLIVRRSPRLYNNIQDTENISRSTFHIVKCEREELGETEKPAEVGHPLHVECPGQVKVGQLCHEFSEDLVWRA